LIHLFIIGKVVVFGQEYVGFFHALQGSPHHICTVG
jgi:hypothetical protein